ncbi:MAG TPA: Na-translocating system protein MpsC family protein [Solirubrobacteraceae bacterium]|nr:Na-translocating system protein MpsC family protein [Solirubrobacteraceae bacterium]
MERRRAHEQPGEALTGQDWRDGSTHIETGGGEMRAALANAMVGLKKRFYGKGPTRAKAYINDVYVFCVLEGGLTRNEETLLDAGEDRLVRDYRLRFQEVMAKPSHEAVEQLTGRRVLGYHSQMVFDPFRSFEIFILDGPPGDEPAAEDRPGG